MHCQLSRGSTYVIRRHTRMGIQLLIATYEKQTGFAQDAGLVFEVVMRDGVVPHPGEPVSIALFMDDLIEVGEVRLDLTSGEWFAEPAGTYWSTRTSDPDCQPA
jgi:hypothetical protein